MNIKQQLRRLNVFGFSACLRITDAVWVALLALRGFSLFEIGLAESIFHIVSILCEVPSGMAADLIGRRRCLAVSGICGTISALFMAFSTQFPGVCISMVFSALSCSFISGSDEALLYDSLLQAKKEDHFINASARYTQLQNIGSMVSNVASLLSNVLSYIGFYLTDAAVSLIRAFTALSLTEPTVTGTQLLRQQNPFKNLIDRLKKHIEETWTFLHTYPGTIKLMIADAFIALPGYLTLMFLQQRLIELGLSAMWLGLPIMCISLSRIVGTELGKHISKIQLHRIYFLAALLTGLGTLLAGAASILPAIVGAMVAASSSDIWMLHFQNHLNTMFPSDHRATLISVDMMAYSLLMILASPMVGWLGDNGPTTGTGLCVLGTVIIVAGILPLIVRYKRKQI